MINDPTLFNDRDTKTENIAIRVTRIQKKRVAQMAERRGVSMAKLITLLLAEENKRQIKEWINDDDIPF